MVIAGLLLWPLVQVFWMSFHDVGIRQLRGDREWPWVGFDNYAEILGDPFFRTVLRNTVVFALANVVLTMILGTLVGLLLNRLRPKMSTVRRHLRDVRLGDAGADRRGRLEVDLRRHQRPGHVAVQRAARRAVERAVRAGGLDRVRLVQPTR